MTSPRVQEIIKRIDLDCFKDEWGHTVMPRDVAIEALTELEAEKAELYEALEMMWEQYCPEPYTHKFMTAGENCEEVLAKYAHLKSNPTTN